MGSGRYGVILACLVLAGLPGQSAGETARPETGRLVASYDAGLAGINLGEFQVTARLGGSSYAMAAQGRFSLLGGLVFKATGKTTSNGTITDASPRPARYTFSFDDSKKRQRLRMTFARGTVTDVTIDPPQRHRRDVPVTAAQLKDVLDPLTAAFLSVRSDAPAGDVSVCNQTVRVFDGRQRFDLQLSPKRSEALDSAPKGLSRRAAVCRVRYKPISGYRPDHPGVQFMTKTEEVEAWLVPIPGTDLYIPYKILVPTSWGSGTVELTGLKANLGTLQRAGVP
ncbi:MAG TPA: DUF3108 domain-containing protein [Methyloceanibacter sp.]|nr:DUF3108 domain-containing protein [Methyloceanibacter sp.]